jgi:hypothetical protein
MTILKNKFFFLSAFLLFLSFSVLAQQAFCAQKRTPEEWSQHLSNETVLNENKIDLRERGIRIDQTLAQVSSCLASDEFLVHCQYWRAVNLGLKLEISTKNLKANLRQMISDFQTVQNRQPLLDDAGAFRGLGYLWLKLPSFPVLGFELKKNLTLARELAQKSVELGPHHFDNHVLRALVAKEDNDCGTLVKHRELAQKLYERAQISYRGKKEFQKEMKGLLKSCR